MTPNETQRLNLSQLSAFLRVNANNLAFDMQDFRTFRAGSHSGSIEHVSAPCGSVGCAIGWGPAAGLEPIEDDANWFAYARRVFGTDGLNDIWIGIFSPDWATVDNTAFGAAERIDRYLTTGELYSPTTRLRVDAN